MHYTKPRRPICSRAAGYVVSTRRRTDTQLGSLEEWRRLAGRSSSAPWPFASKGTCCIRPLADGELGSTRVLLAALDHRAHARGHDLDRERLGHYRHAGGEMAVAEEHVLGVAGDE